MMRPKQVNRLFFLILLAGAAIGVIGTLSEIAVVSIIGMVTMVGSLLFKVIFYRCPHCRRFLDRNTGDFCPYCGKELS